MKKTAEHFGYLIGRTFGRNGTFWRNLIPFPYFGVPLKFWELLQERLL